MELSGDGAVRATLLPHGLSVVTERIDASRTFSVGVFARVGSRHETPALHGASHFLEHVLFKGTRKRSAEEISAAIECVGGELNAYTAKEHTCFYARVLPEDAALAVDVLTDMLSHASVAADDVEAERAVILDEIAMHADDPADLAAEMAAAEVFGSGRSSPLGLAQPVIGSPGSIAAMRRDQIVRHWRRHYQPGNVVVAAAGLVDHDRLVDQLGAFDDRAVRAAPRPPEPTLIRPSSGVLARTIRLEQSTAMLAWPGIGVFDERRYAHGLLTLIVGGGMASRLFVEVRERRGLTYGIDAGESSYADAGIWSVDWQCAPGRLLPIAQIVRSTLHEVAEHGVTDAELQRAKGQMRGQTMLSYETPSSRMSRLGANAMLGDERTLDEVLRRFDEVSAEQVRAEAAAVFLAPPTLAVVGPKVPLRRLESLLGSW